MFPAIQNQCRGTNPMAEEQMPKFLLLQDVVNLTGLSESTVRRRVRDGSIKAVQPGGRRTRLLVDADSLGGLLTSSATSTNATRSPDQSTPTQLAGPRPRWQASR